MWALVLNACLIWFKWKMMGQTPLPSAGASPRQRQGAEKWHPDIDAPSLNINIAPDSRDNGQ